MKHTLRRFQSRSAIWASTALALVVAAACAAPTAPPVQPAAATSGSAAKPAAQAVATSAPSGDLRRVTFRQSWIPDDLFLPYTTADKKGFYREAGIEFVNQIGDGGATAIKLVANGDATFGSGEGSHVLLAGAQGVPVVAIAAQFQDTPGSVMTLKQSGITSLEQLKGKKVGGASASSTTPTYRAALVKQGINPDDIQFVNIAPPGEQAALLAGQIDGAIQFAGNVTALKAKGGEINTISLRDAGIRVPGTTIFVRKDTLEKDPKLVKDFTAATMKGMRYALDHPEEAAKFLKESYPDVNEQVVLDAWKITKEYVTSDVTQKNGLGWQDLEHWKTLHDIWLEAKLINAPTDVTKLFTNSVLEQIPASER